MRSPFFQAVDEANLLNRIDNILANTGAYLPMTTELRTLMYLSNAVKDRENKKQPATPISPFTK